MNKDPATPEAEIALLVEESYEIEPELGRRRPRAKETRRARPNIRVHRHKLSVAYKIPVPGGSQDTGTMLRLDAFTLEDPAVSRDLNVFVTGALPPGTAVILFDVQNWARSGVVESCRRRVGGRILASRPCSFEVLIRFDKQ